MSRGRGPALFALFALLTFLPAAHAFGASAAQLASELQGRGIRDPHVLDAIRRVPRDAFAPSAAHDHAYDDTSLDIGHGQTMSQPYVVALMAQQLGLEGNERVLEIGTGSGYNAAVLGTLAHEVYSVELIPELASAARLALTRAGYRNVHVKQGDGTLGWREYGPYDAIVVTAAGPTVPRALIDQLREGGVLVMPVGDPNGRQVLVRGVKRGLKLRTREIAEVRFVPLLGGGAGYNATAEPRRQPPRDDAGERRRPPALDTERRPPAAAHVEERQRSAPPSVDVDEDEGRRSLDVDEDERRPPSSPNVEEHERRPPSSTDVQEHERRPSAPDLEERRRERDADLEDEEHHAPDDRGDRARPAPDVERRPPRDLNEEDLREEDGPDSENDTRPLPAARTRVARAPSAPGSDRRCAARAAACVDAGSPATARRSAA